MGGYESRMAGKTARTRYGVWAIIIFYYLLLLILIFLPVQVFSNTFFASSWEIKFPFFMSFSPKLNNFAKFIASIVF